MKTGSESHNYKLPKRGIICNLHLKICIFCMETGLLLFKYLLLVHYFLVMVDYLISDSH